MLARRAWRSVGVDISATRPVEEASSNQTPSYSGALLELSFERQKTTAAANQRERREHEAERWNGKDTNGTRMESEDGEEERREEEKKERGEKEREITETHRCGWCRAVAGGGCHCGWSEACPTTSPRLLLSTLHRSDQGSRIAVD